MQIIEEIGKNRINKSVSGSTLQKICLDKLQINPLPNHKSEIWRMANKSKLARFLDYKLSHDFYESFDDMLQPHKNALMARLRYKHE